VLRPDGTGLMWTSSRFRSIQRSVPQRKGLRVRGTIRGVRLARGKLDRDGARESRPAAKHAGGGAFGVSDVAVQGARRRVHSAGSISKCKRARA